MSRFIIMKKIKNFINRLANRIITRTHWYNEDFWQGTTKFWNISSCDYEVMNLGSNSGKYSFNYDNISTKGFNAAIGPQSLVHDFNILKNYFSYLKDGGIVLIPLCPFSCLYSSYSKESNFKYYPILHPATIIDFDDNERTKAYKIRYNPLRAMPKLCIKRTLKEYLKKMLPRRRRTSNFDYDKNAEMWVNLWKKQFNIDNLDESLSEKHQQEQISRRETLQEMILFCKERNLRPYIVLPPVHPTLSSRLSNSFMKNYVYDFVEPVMDKEAILLDYFNNISFHKDEYFQNSFFMSKEGANTFTKKILMDIGIL